jgi:monofunctional biosynthetic peptidoglycan transglycosylase
MVYNQKLLIDFSSRGAAEKWRVVNDGVMGGLSTSRMESAPGGMAVFLGELSLENNGGFASVRTALDRADLSDYDGIILRVRGDGRSYQLRFRTDKRFDGPTYRAVFATKPGQWIEVRLPFSDFQPTYRGRILRGMGPLDTGHLHQLALMVADKKDGPFRLEIAWIKAFAS